METVLITRPMQWAATPDISETDPLSQNDKNCLREMRDVLDRFGCLDRFGVNLIHKHFEIADDEALLETIDVEERTLTVRPVKKADLGPSIETQWNLRRGDAYIACPVFCSPGGGHRAYHRAR
jgi:hypothetical protein